MQSASNIFAKWRKYPEYVKEYNALEDDFSAAEALIEAPKCVELSQDEAATLTDTSQSTIAAPVEACEVSRRSKGRFGLILIIRSMLLDKWTSHQN